MSHPIRLEGKTVILEEIQPKYFPYVIEWRNNPELNKYLNQPFKLTMELQEKWYELEVIGISTSTYALRKRKNGSPKTHNKSSGQPIKEYSIE